MDQTAGNALNIFDRLYPELAPVVPVNSQDVVVVTVLNPSKSRYDATAPTALGHWQGLCRLAHHIAMDNAILWLVVDQGHEVGDDNVKELIKALKLPARSAYIFGNGAEKGLDVAFEHIRRNKISGTVYLASPDDAHKPQLWAMLRKRMPSKIGVFTVGLRDFENKHRQGPGSSAEWEEATEAGLAFDAAKLHKPTPQHWGIEWVRGLLPSKEQRIKVAAGETLPDEWQVLCSDSDCQTPLVALHTNQELAKITDQVPDECLNTPGERMVSVVQL